ncbi:hypothetical protein JM79_1294 [Gramella sp. Hel_I_59]|uniref:hypothetical protein n=1 Tax=Gramella sp. Hel_I_59 TaxID=1249978 RepID=UPI00114DAEFE|nr:hypothetical protein [Gramella sp. Hel_I_59]TQI70384.1 hypothetical protein JM79_1294 [Gramella sp. Hel_I_59]
MMKFINKYIALVAVFAMMFTSCSKDESSEGLDDAELQAVEITFGASLNDLVDRAAQSISKDHFNTIPDCSDAEPAVARIDFSYGGNSYQTDVSILKDANGYFTDYSEDLKILVPNNGQVTISLDGFMVYDGDPDTTGNLIWVAPKESDGDFDGYVDQALPFDFTVEDGTKPYIDVEVLCFDRRMVNEYGYVFFDILPEVIYPLCLFVNYCDEDGRHYVADYSIDLYFGEDASGIQLYDHTESSAMASTGDYGDGQYYADPLCLVVPGPPANLGDNEPYLFMVLYPQDWDGTGDIDNSPIQGITLSWNMVKSLLNGDGTTNEYYHLLIGECEGALTGDGTGGNGGGTGDTDLDNDGVDNDVDQCPNTPAGATVNAVGCPDSDGDGVYDNDDLCEETPTGTTVDEDGCPVDVGGTDCGTATWGRDDLVEGFGLVIVSDFAFPVRIFAEASTLDGLNENLEIGSIQLSTVEGGIGVAINLEDGDYEVTGYTISASLNADGSDPIVESGSSIAAGGSANETLTIPSFDDLYLKIEFDICEVSVN